MKRSTYDKAKERQREAGRTYGEKHPKQEVPPTLAEALKGETRDKAAEAIGMKRIPYRNIAGGVPPCPRGLREIGGSK